MFCVFVITLSERVFQYAWYVRGQQSFFLIFCTEVRLLCVMSMEHASQTISYLGIFCWNISTLSTYTTDKFAYESENVKNFELWCFLLAIFKKKIEHLCVQYLAISCSKVEFTSVVCQLMKHFLKYRKRHCFGTFRKNAGRSWHILSFGRQSKSAKVAYFLKSFFWDVKTVSKVHGFSYNNANNESSISVYYLWVMLDSCIFHIRNICSKVKKLAVRF